MSWFPFMIAAIIGWGIYDVLYAKISEQFPPSSAFLLIAFFQLLIFGIGYLLLERGDGRLLSLNNLPILILAAALLSLGNIALFFAFKMGAPISVVIPSVTIGIAILGVFWGLIVAKEPLNLPIFFGLILSVVGVILLNIKR